METTHDGIWSSLSVYTCESRPEHFITNIGYITLLLPSVTCLWRPPYFFLQPSARAWLTEPASLSEPPQHSEPQKNSGNSEHSEGSGDSEGNEGSERSEPPCDLDVIEVDELTSEMFHERWFLPKRPLLIRKVNPFMFITYFSLYSVYVQC